MPLERTRVMQLEQGAGQSSLVPDKDVVKKSFKQFRKHTFISDMKEIIHFCVPGALISLTFGPQGTLQVSDFPGRFAQHLATLFSPHPWEITHHLDFWDKASQCPTAFGQSMINVRTSEEDLKKMSHLGIVPSASAVRAIAVLQDCVLLCPTRLPGQLKRLSELFSLSNAPAPSPQSFLTSMLATRVAWTIPTSSGSGDVGTDSNSYELGCRPVAPRSSMR